MLKSCGIRIPPTTMFKDYYAILNITPKASAEEIKYAYKKAALETHPDRVSPSARARATEQFQLVNEAYYVLSDNSRRAQYDRERASSSAKPRQSFFSRTNPQPQSQSQQGGPSFGFRQSFSDSQFEQVFNEMMNETSTRGIANAFWTIVGTLAGAALGFITFDVPGVLVGSAAGAKLGRIRDTHGKSAYSVFQDMPAVEKARILTQFLSHLLNSSKQFTSS